MVTDVTLRVIIIRRLIKNQDYQNIDSKTEFLYAVTEEEIYMNIPEGMEEVREEYYMHKDILTLIKKIYGLIQAAHCWFK